MLIPTNPNYPHRNTRSHPWPDTWAPCDPDKLPTQRTVARGHRRPCPAAAVLGASWWAGNVPAAQTGSSDPEKAALLHHLDGLPSTPPPGWSVSPRLWKLKKSAPFFLRSEAGRRWSQLLLLVSHVTAVVSEEFYMFTGIWFASFSSQHLSSMQEDYHPFSFSFLHFSHCFTCLILFFKFILLHLTYLALFANKGPSS